MAPIENFYTIEQVTDAMLDLAPRAGGRRPDRYA
jgi:hypothetical protein